MGNIIQFWIFIRILILSGNNIRWNRAYMAKLFPISLLKSINKERGKLSEICKKYRKNMRLAWHWKIIGKPKDPNNVNMKKWYSIKKEIIRTCQSTLCALFFEFAKSFASSRTKSIAQQPCIINCCQFEFYLVISY